MATKKRKPRKAKERDDSKKSRVELEREAMQGIAKAQGESYLGLARPFDNGTATRTRNLLLLRNKGLTLAEIGESLRLRPETVERLLAELDALAAKIPPAPKGRPRKDRLTGKPSARVDQKRNN